MILREERVEWCKRRADWRAVAEVNSRKAQPLEAGFEEESEEAFLGVRRRTVGTSPAATTSGRQLSQILAKRREGRTAWLKVLLDLVDRDRVGHVAWSEADER